MFRRWRRYLKLAGDAIYIALVPVETRWYIAQDHYLRWSSKPIPPTYLEYIKSTGARFSEFVGEPTRMIDVGCGNGLYNGVSYEEAGYIPLKRGGGYILGVDPLPLLKPIPWISDFKQGRIEDLRLEGFNEAAFVTTFDHISRPDAAIESLKRAGVTRLYLWETLFKRHTSGDRDHPYHYTYGELISIFNDHGFRVTRDENVRRGGVAEEYFIEANRRRENEKT